VPSAATLDLRYAPSDAEPADGASLSLGDVVALARRPRALAAALGDRARGELRVRVDDRPFSGVEALALLVASVLRNGSVTLVRPDGARAFSARRFRAQALLAAARAVPRELLGTFRLYRRAQATAARGPQLPHLQSSPDSVLYLRTEPSLRWHGQVVGGASTHTSGVINGFVANGLEVEVMAAERPEWTDRAQFTQVPLRRVFHLVPWLTLAAYGDEIVKAASDSRPAFVYQRYSLGTWAGLELAQRLGRPLVLEYNGSELWIQSHWGSGREARFMGPLQGIERRNVQSASLVVVVSEILKEQLVATGGIPAERVLVAPNGVDVDRLERYRERSPAQWRADRGLAEAPTVGFVGSFGVWHGVRLLPAMAARVAEHVPAARWLLIGDGDLHAEVRAEIESCGLGDRVLMPGIVPHGETLAMLAGCDVCVSPHVPNADGSRFFGSPTKLFEYMGLARPIVASDLEQLGEVIVDGESGLLCPPGDPDAAAAAVVRLLADADLRARLSAGALDRATSAYSWRAHTARILRALRTGDVTQEQDVREDPLASGSQ
jgi:glycosyltransferase involved in cell wall biosynthesis